MAIMYMYVCMHVHMYLRTYVCIYVYVYVCMYACVCMCVCIYGPAHVGGSSYARMAFTKEVLGVCPHRVSSVSIRFNPTFCETISRLLLRY